MQLFSRPECHLCDDALAILARLGLADHVSVVNIETDLNLLRQYGDKVPVLLFPLGQRLYWPFSAEDIKSAAKEQIK